MNEASSPQLPSLAEQAYERLEHGLVTLDLAPGSVVSEGVLIEWAGLGRTPVRELLCDPPILLFITVIFLLLLKFTWI